MIIDAKDLLLGRMGSFIAKKALMGEKIDIINCEQSVISGDRLSILAAYKQMHARGIPATGPFHHAMPDKLVRRTIRGMLPHKRQRGKDAYKRIHCHIGFPASFKDQKIETVQGAHSQKLPNIKYMRVRELSKLLGAKL